MEILYFKGYDNIVDTATSKGIPILKIAIDNVNDEISKLYKDSIDKNNNNILNNIHCDSGFDIFFTNTIHIPYTINKACLIDLGIKCEMIKKDKNSITPLPFYVYPRSSFSKTPLILANHVGIIDSGYRGTLKGAVKNFDKDNDHYTCSEFTRLFQICSPDLSPFFVCLVDSHELSSTQRNDGGFGSTGK